MHAFVDERLSGLHNEFIKIPHQAAFKLGHKKSSAFLHRTKPSRTKRVRAGLESTRCALVTRVTGAHMRLEAFELVGIHTLV